MNWLQHPIARAAANAAGRLYGGWLGCLNADDARQEGAIRAWRLAGRQVSHQQTGERVVTDIMRRVGALSRDGTPRGDRQRSTAQLSDWHDVADPSPGPDEQAMRAQALRQAAARLASMPRRWQQVATGVLQGDDLETIGLRMEPPVSTTRVSQMLRQIIRHVQHGHEPWRVERGERADIDAAPAPHAVKAMQALQTLRARSALQTVLDAQRAHLQQIDAARIASQASTARALYQQTLRD